MMHVPANAGKRHFVIDSLGGLDALLAVIAPKRLMLRILAVKLLRGWHELPADKSVWAAWFSTVREFEAGSFSFMYEGELFAIDDTRGRTRVIPRGTPAL